MQSLFLMKQLNLYYAYCLPGLLRYICTLFKILKKSGTYIYVLNTFYLKYLYSIPTFPIHYSLIFNLNNAKSNQPLRF